MGITNTINNNWIKKDKLPHSEYGKSLQEIKPSNLASLLIALSILCS